VAEELEFDSSQGNIYSLLHDFQTHTGTHPTSSYTMRTGDSSPRVKRSEHEAHHSPPSRAQVKNAWGYTSTRLHGVVLN
jgi:hypothetical protein